MSMEPDTHHSSTLEKILEARFLADLKSALWLRNRRLIEILHGSVDAFGYDVVIEVDHRPRHIQLKTLRQSGKRTDFTINTRLACKPSGCVIVIQYDPQTLEIGPFLWFGGAPGEPLPDLGLKPGRHTKGNRDGVKLERPGHRVVPRSAFKLIRTIPELAERLFGSGESATTNPDPDAAGFYAGGSRQDGLALIRAALGKVKRDGWFQGPMRPWLAEVQAERWEAIPPDLTYEESVELAHLVDGYELARLAGLGDPAAYLDRTMSAARETGQWTGSALELWVTLFFLHRSDRQAGEFADTANPLRDALCRALRARLIAEQSAGPAAPSRRRARR